MFVGNIDKSIPFDEVKKYFYDKYSSIISAKLIINPQTKKSKGYAFIEFTNYKEFHDALNIKEPLVFGRQTLVLNSAKNRFDIEELKDLNQICENTYIDNNVKSLDNLNEYTHQQINSLSSTETGVSSIRNSKESNTSGNDNGEKISNISHSLSDKIDNNNINNDNYKETNNSLELEIKDSLKKMSTYYNINQNNNNSPLFNYYCSSFFDNNINDKNISSFTQFHDNNVNSNNFSRTFPYDSCENSY